MFNTSLTKVLLLILGLSMAFCSTYPRLAEYNGQGYDIFYGNPLSKKVDEGFTGRRAFELTYDEGRKTTDNYFYFPNEVEVAVDLSCSFSSTSKTITGLASYQEELSTKASVSGSINGLVAKVKFSASTAYSEMKDTLSTNNQMSILTQAVCKLYRGTMKAHNAVVSEDFKKSVAIALSRGDWTTFVNDWGTHYASVITYGASAIQETVMSREAYQALETSGVDVSAKVSAKFGASKGSATASYSLSDSQESAFTSAVTKTTSSYIGLEPPSSGDTTEWLSNIKESKPVPISFELKPLTEVFKTHFFGGEESIYTQIQLDNMASSLSAAVISIAQTMDQVPDLDAFLQDSSVSITSSAVYGNPTTAQTFEDSVSTDQIFARPSKIRYCKATNGYVAGLGITITDGAAETEKEFRGTTTTNCGVWTIPDDHTISKIVIRAGTNIDGIEFFTDKGAQSPLIGNTLGGATTTITVTGHLVGFYGSYGAFLDSIGFKFKNLLHTQTPMFVSKQTSTYGNFVDGTEDFADPARPSSTLTLKKIYVWAGANIDGLEFEVEDNGETYSIHRGGYGGGKYTYNVTAKISSIKINYTPLYITAIQFILEDGTTSSLYGSIYGNTTSKIVNIPGRVTGIFGTSMDNMIKTLDFNYNTYV